MHINETKKRYKCKAYIIYEFIIYAESQEEAENNVFETIADDISKGIIPMDIYDSSNCFPVPLLLSVDITPINENK